MAVVEKAPALSPTHDTKFVLVVVIRLDREGELA